MRVLIKNIRQLLQVREHITGPLRGDDLTRLPLIGNAWLALEDDLITGYGSMDDWEGIADWRDLTVIDASDRLVLPAWCDSHTHIVFAGTREGEFVDRIRGLTYEEIFARGGGILNSAKRMQSATREELVEGALLRIQEILSQGTGAVEIKSGYGLTVESELEMLRAIREAGSRSRIPVRSTFLGAHAIPGQLKENRQEYIRQIVQEMMPVISAEKLADYCDVFCEQNYFTPDETTYILGKGREHGMIPKVHAEQLSNSGGVLAGVKVNAQSVDHLEYVGEQEIEALKNSGTIATLLPGAAFFLSLPFPPARRMIDAGVAVAIASDYNPGSCPSGNMNLMVSICCIQYKMTPDEAINAATLNGAFAMGLGQTHGSITIGKKANLIITRPLPGYEALPYFFGTNPVETVIADGKIIHSNN